MKPLILAVSSAYGIVSTYEQVEEEDNFNKLIDKVKLVKDAGLYHLDKEVGLRVFVPIV